MSKLTVHWGDRQYILEAEKGQRLLDVLAQNEITVYAPCKGNGSCKKCRVSYLISGETKEVLSCQTLVTEDAEVWVPKISGGGVTDFDAVQVAVGETGFGAAVDIGTTTIAAALVDLSSGQILDKCAVLNPQHVCGSDVLSRIVACSEGKLELQTSLVRKEIADILSKLCLKQGVDVLNLVTVCGNTTMLHLFCGVDPAPIGVFPFTPVFTELRCLDGVELGIPALSVYVLPSASGYIGSDIIWAFCLRSWTGERFLFLRTWEPTANWPSLTVRNWSVPLPRQVLLWKAPISSVALAVFPVQSAAFPAKMTT